MRIAQVTATFPPYQGGTGNVCAYAARELARRGHEVQVLTAAAPDGRGSERPGAPQAPDGACLQVRRLRPLLRVGNAPLLPGLIGALRGFDLVHLHYPFIFGTEAAVLASALYGTPLVVSFHNDLIGDGLRAPLFSIYQRLAACLTLRGAARLCAVSLDHYASSQLSRALSDRPDLAVELPNGVDAEHFCVPGPRADLCRLYGVAPGARVLLFVAALDRAHHFKGLGTLLQALGSLPPDVWLLIVGDGDQRAEHELTVRRLGLAARTVFAGRLDQQSLPPVYRSVELTVLPSSPPESFGLVLIESLACGTPAVASRIPGVRTVIDHGADGLLVPPGDPAALSGAIRHLLSDEPLRRAMGRHGRAKVEQRYAWAQIGARLESIYQQVRLEAHPRARALEYEGR
jgi:glycosyltransferase involved in cell wall biosynthesis